MKKPLEIIATGLVSGGLLFLVPVGIGLADPPNPNGSTAPGNSGTTPGVDKGNKNGWENNKNPHFNPPIIPPPCNSPGGPIC